MVTPPAHSTRKANYVITRFSSRRIKRKTRRPAAGKSNGRDYQHSAHPKWRLTGIDEQILAGRPWSGVFILGQHRTEPSRVRQPDTAGPRFGAAPLACGGTWNRSGESLRNARATSAERGRSIDAGWSD